MQDLGSLVETDYRGPKARFGEAQVLKAIVELGRSGRIGRGRLAKLLDLGAGEARTLIRRLKAADLIKIDSGGCALTKAGARRYHEIEEAIPWSSEIPNSQLGIGAESFALIVRRPKVKLRKGIEQRDAAIKAGATGALSVAYKLGKFFEPYEGVDCEKRGPTAPWKVIRSAPPKNGDIVVISGGDNLLEAEYGALSAALTLL